MTITEYGHMKAMNVRTGQIVRQGEQIGQVGNEGNSTGAHLHFGVNVKDVPVDPIKAVNGQDFQQTADLQTKQPGTIPPPQKKQNKQPAVVVVPVPVQSAGGSPAVVKANQSNNQRSKPWINMIAEYFLG